MGWAIKKEEVDAADSKSSFGNLGIPTNTSSEFKELKKTKLSLAIKKHIENKESTHGKDNKFHPSQMDRMCHRAHMFSIYNYKELDGEVRSGSPVLDMGTAIHWWYQNHHLADMGILKGNWKCIKCNQLHKDVVAPDKCDSCETPRKEGTDEQINILYQEVRVSSDKYGVVGSIDGVIIRPEAPQGVRIWDLKTINNHRMTGLQGIHLHYITQMMWYMECTGIHETEVTYVNKDNSTMRTFLLAYDPKYLDRQKLNVSLTLEICEELDKLLASDIEDADRKSILMNKTRCIMKCKSVIDGEKCPYVGDCFPG